MGKLRQGRRWFGGKREVCGKVRQGGKGMPRKEGHRRNRGKEGKVVPPRGSPESLPHLHELLESEKCLPPTINPRQHVLKGE